MQYQLAKNSIKTQTKQQLIERNLKNSTITTYNIIKLSLIFKMKKISNHQLFKKKNLLQKGKKKSKFEKSNSKKIYKLNSILHYIHTTQFLIFHFKEKKKKEKFINFCLRFKYPHRTHSKSKIEKSVGFNRFDRSDHFLRSGVFQRIHGIVGTRDIHVARQS